MHYHKPITFFILIFFVLLLSSCGATRLSYTPTVNPNVLEAMQSIREKILTQDGKNTPYLADVTESTLKVQGNFKGVKIEGENSVGLIHFKEITELAFHHKKTLFSVTIYGERGFLYRYFSNNEENAKKFMDSIHTMMQHNPDPNKPIVLNNQPILNRNHRFTIKDLNYAD